MELKKGDLIAVAMSGGVDSSVAAGLMVQKGYNVVGITMQLYDHGEMVSRKGACCAGQDIYDAKLAADTLGIPHYVLDFESVFKTKVMEDFVASYLNGETPVPCIRCNQKVKFQDLLLMARNLEAKALVTGHYVQRIVGEHDIEMHAGADLSRDQSYFMFTTNRSQLEYLRFPLGAMSKHETRKLAHDMGLKTADKPDSQDICFVAGGKYADVVKKLHPNAAEEGDIIDLNGNVLGKHHGIINFTVGQRRGLRVSDKNPLYVLKLDPLTKQVIVGPKEALAVSSVRLKELNILTSEDLHQTDVMVKMRSTQIPVPAMITVHNDDKATVDLTDPEYGISAGQACVFYRKNRVLGGGWIV